MSQFFPHPLMKARFSNVYAPFLRGAFNRFLSDGGSAYYFLREGFGTRLHIFNYFTLLAGEPFAAHWEVKFFSPDGRRSRIVRGQFNDAESVVLNAADHVGGLGDVGLCIAHIRPAQKALVMNVSYPTIFFIELFSSAGISFIHSFAYPVPKVYHATDTITGSVGPTDELFLLLSNSCDRVFGTPAILKKRGPSLTIENANGEKRSVDLPPVAPLSCRVVHFNEIWQDLPRFFGEKPGLITVAGPNVFYSPLCIQKKANGSLAIEHFQGHMWGDVPVSKGAR